MPTRLIIAYALIAFLIAAAAAAIARIRYMNPKNVRRRERDRSGY